VTSAPEPALATLMNTIHSSARRRFSWRFQYKPIRVRFSNFLRQRQCPSQNRWLSLRAWAAFILTRPLGAANSHDDCVDADREVLRGPEVQGPAQQPMSARARDAVTFINSAERCTLPLPAKGCTGSKLCAMAPNLQALIALRVIQGLGRSGGD